MYTDKWVGSWFGDTYGATTAVYLGVFVMLSTVYGMLALARSLAFLFFCVRASVNTHNRLLDHVLVLPKSFFDTNPAGGSWWSRGGHFSAGGQQQQSRLLPT